MMLQKLAAAAVLAVYAIGGMGYALGVMAHPRNASDDLVSAAVFVLTASVYGAPIWLGEVAYRWKTGTDAKRLQPGTAPSP